MQEGGAERFEHPLASRYASREMQALFAPRRRALVWRDLWIALARAQRELGLPIRPEQIEALERARDAVDLARVAELEKDLRHDVMAHVRHFAEQAPEAGPILHLGATSCFVTDNGDLILFREALRLLAGRLRALLKVFARRIPEWRDMACLSWTHYQPAQPTTYGRRACAWAQDFCDDLDEIERLARRLPFRGAKGTTGTQASYLALFDGDHAKVCELDRRLAQAFGFEHLLPISTQTYPRKVDHKILAALAGIAQSAARLGVDLRLLSHDGEVQEPFEERQIGSSAMAYKRNPMRSERICSLARYLLVLEGTAGHTTATQWLERSLDDSAIRRIALPEAFLAADALLGLAHNVVAGMSVHADAARRRLAEQLPFMVTEEILMAAVRAGGDRQELHEKIRRHSIEAARRVREAGVPNPLLDLLRADPAFAAVHDRLDALTDPDRLVGRSREQADDFLATELRPRLRAGPSAPAAPPSV